MTRDEAFAQWWALIGQHLTEGDEMFSAGWRIGLNEALCRLESDEALKWDVVLQAGEVRRVLEEVRDGK